MALSSFDPNVFLNQDIKGANEIKYTPIPKGEYQAYIDDISMDQYEQQPILVVTLAILSDELKQTLGLEKPTIQDRIFLDYENGALLFGMNKNVKLGRLREAVKQNDGKKPWNFNMLRNQGPIMIMVDHVPGKGENAGEVYSRITRYAAGKK